MLSWIFSIFKIPKLSRAVSGCDAQNIMLRGNCFKHLWKPPRLNVRSGRDTTFSIPDLKTVSTSASIVEAGLDRVWRTESKAPPHGCPPEPSQHVSELLQVTPKPSTRRHLLKPVGRIPQLKKSIPTTEPTWKSTTYPDYEFPINTPPTPSLPTDYTVPCSPLFPTQSSNSPSLSPLSIILSFSPPAAPPPPELTIKILGPEGYLKAVDHKSQISDFLSSRAAEVANSLVVIWQPSHIDSGGERGLTSLKSLFAQLDELDSDRTALSRFSKLSIKIPDLVKDVAPYNDLLLQPVKEDNIDLANATDLHEFAWNGDYRIFASKFSKNLSCLNLKSLNIKSSNISIEDAISLLYLCSNVHTVSLGTIQSESEKKSDRMSMKSSRVKRKTMPNLTYLALESDVALHPLIRRFRWTKHVSLNLTLRKQGTASLVRALDSGSQEHTCPYLAQLRS